MNPCKIDNLTIGEKPILLCTVLEDSVEATLSGVEAAKNAGADCIELRIDKLKSDDAVIDVLKKVKFPSLVVCRPKEWDGFFEGSEANRIFKRLFFAIENGANAIDIETIVSQPYKTRLIEAAQKKKIPAVLCYENFKETPTKENLLKILQEAEKLGADVAKFAVMANSFDDMLTVLQVTVEAKKVLKIPFITIAMGAYGSASRPLACVLGSAGTYCKRSPKKSGAPGQLTVKETREIIDILNVK